MADENTEIIDEEEYEYINKMKELKITYKEVFSQLQSSKGEIDYLTHVVDRCREKLISEFDQWFNETFDHGQGSKSHDKVLTVSSEETITDVVEVKFPYFSRNFTKNFLSRMYWITKKSLRE